jgi:hypothetical protein
MSFPGGLPKSDSRVSDLGAPATTAKTVDAEIVRHNTEEVLPKGDIAAILPKPPEIRKHGDDLIIHQDRIEVTDANLLRVLDAVQKVFCPISNGVQKKSDFKEIPKLDKAMEKLRQQIDKARSQAAHGEFALAEKSCEEAWNEFDLAYKDLENEFLACLDEKKFDKELIKEAFTQAKNVIRESIDFAKATCKECAAYLTQLNSAASVELKVVEKSTIENAFKDLHQARASLQRIWDGKEAGDVAEAKTKVKNAFLKCHDLTWDSGNAVIAKKQMVGKAQLAASFIPKATAEKIFTLATQEVGSLEKPGLVVLEGRQFEVAHDLSKKGHQIIRLPIQEIVLGKGAWNVVVRVCNISNKCFQALRKPLTPPGEQPPGEEHMLRSIEIYKDISKLQGTTVGPEALIRKGAGGVLSSLYSDDVIKWMRLIPPPELRWESFKSALRSFIEFAKDGNVHGDLHPGNLSVVYAENRTDKIGATVYAAPGTVKIEDLDGACHIIEGYDDEKNPIFSKKAVDVGIVCKFATQEEVDKWIKCIDDKDLKGIADVRFRQDILAMGITLYQILSLDFDIDNLYLNKECSPFTDMEGKVVEGKFEEGIFRKGNPNTESIRFILEEYSFLTSEQKEKIIKFISLAITQNTEERATLTDFETAMII